MASTEPTIFEFGGYSLDIDRRVLFNAAGEALPLMPKAIDTLAYLVRNRGKVVTKDELLSSIWPDSIVEENNLTQNISILRRTLGEKRGERRYIATVPGHGYKFVAEVNELARDADAEARPDDLTEEADSALNVEQASAAEVVTNSGAGRSRAPYKAVAGLVAASVVIAVIVWQVWPDDPDVPIRSVAVLPFNNASPNEETDYLSDAIAESVINSLSRLTELRVISRNSTFRFKDAQPDSRAIGSQLGVEALVTGDIRQIGEDLVINVRLTRTRDDAQIWGYQYVKRPVDLIGVQSEIAQAIAQNLKVRLSQRDSQILAKRDTDNAEAWELYHRGRFHVFKLTPDEVQRGMEYFRQAIELDPNYALAYSGIGDGYRSLTLGVEMPPAEYLGLAKAASLKAIELDETLADGHVGLGATHFWGDWNWAEAEKRFVRALELNPNNAMAHLFYAHLNSNTGRHDEALERIAKFRELDPVFPFGNALEGQFLLHAGRPDEALERLAKTLEIAPNFWMPHLFISAAYIEKGEFEKAIVAARRASELSPAQTTSLAIEAFALAKAGKPQEAEAILGKLLERSRERFVPPTHIALVYHGLDDNENAFEWLEKGMEVRDPKMTFLKVDRKWNALRDDPRFREILRRLHFE
jgi:DNA-binding winged helix-turn-helix (wHTH) protein/TolB-like protein/Flp pilus assembly protein TadD